MDLTDILSDAFHYPLSDYKKILKIGIPYLILGIMTLILGFQAIEITEIADERILSSSLGLSFVITLLLFYIVAIVASLIMSGISISVIRETINQSDRIPEIDLKNNIVDGLKSFVVVLIYIGIPVMILTIILAALIFAKSPGFLIAIIAIIFIIAIVLLGILVSVALGRLAETGSVSESFNFKYILDTSKKIGMGKIFITDLICGIILAILGIVASLLELIPFIGVLLVMYLFYTYSNLVSARTCGLLYRERNSITAINNMYQNPVDNVDYNQQSNQGEMMAQSSSVNDFNSVNNQSYDFHPDSDQEANVEEQKVDDVKICSKCGYTNPDFVNICVNCGNKL